MKACEHHLCVLPLPQYSLLASPRKELIHLSGVLTFDTATQGSPLEHLAVCPVGLTCVIPQDCVHLHTLKAAACGMAPS